MNTHSRALHGLRRASSFSLSPMAFGRRGARHALNIGGCIRLIKMLWRRDGAGVHSLSVKLMWSRYCSSFDYVISNLHSYRNANEIDENCLAKIFPWPYLPSKPVWSRSVLPIWVRRPL